MESVWLSVEAGDTSECKWDAGEEGEGAGAAQSDLSVQAAVCRPRGEQLTLSMTLRTQDFAFIPSAVVRRRPPPYSGLRACGPGERASERLIGPTPELLAR